MAKNGLWGCHVIKYVLCGAMRANSCICDKFTSTHNLFCSHDSHSLFYSITFSSSPTHQQFPWQFGLQLLPPFRGFFLLFEPLFNCFFAMYKLISNTLMFCFEICSFLDSFTQSKSSQWVFANLLVACFFFFRLSNSRCSHSLYTRSRLTTYILENSVTTLCLLLEIFPL